MNSYIDNTYWISIAHLPKWHIERINRLIIRIIHENNMSWNDFFELEKNRWREIFAFSDKELIDLECAKNELPRIAFIAEQLQNEGFQIIPINSPDYPTVLKDNLKIKSSPPILYIKGRRGLLQEDPVAIVGSRNAGHAALNFTDQVAKKLAKELKVVVSGFAKGVDKQALDSTIEANGKSIIVLPQGILTFNSGFKKYYESIVTGNVLVLSSFFPKAAWDVGFAMARNAYIYGLAKEIYVAETDNKGGTWEGAMDGLQKQRKIYVREPELKEVNSNLKLIEFGAIPVNNEGVPIDLKTPTVKNLFEDQSEKYVLKESGPKYNDVSRNVEEEIIELLKKENYTTREIILALKLDWDSRKLTGFLKKNPNIRVITGKQTKYGLNNEVNLKLF